MFQNLISHKPSHHWEKFHGHIPHNAVHASDAYVVARANHNGQWIPGKLNVKDKSVHIPYDSKEVLVKSDIEVLVHAPGAEVLWVPASHGQVGEGSIGPMGQDGLFVGRAVCPYPENKHTPGKIHPAQKCLYLPWGGAEKKFDQYEFLVIKPASHHHQQPSHHHQQPTYIIDQFSNNNANVTVTSNEPFRWVPWQGSVPQNAVKAGDAYLVIRAFHANEWVPGKLFIPDGKAYIPYSEKEVHVTQNIEVLTHLPGTEVVWVPASHGQVVQGAVGPIGRDGTFVGRVVCPKPENRFTPGKIHPAHKCLYLPWGGKENKFDSYDVCVIKPQGSLQPNPNGQYQQQQQQYQQQQQQQGNYSGNSACHWVPWQGTVPSNAVHAGSAYVVIRAYHANDVIPGKLSVTERKAYIPFDSKEVHVTQNIEVLTHAPGAEVAWVPVSHGNVPQGAVGPFGKDATFVGRVVCPQPENAHTPGKIHPAHKCLYLPWGGKENKFENYEACVIQFPQQYGYPNIGNLVINPQPGFGQPGFGQPSFGQPTFVQPGFIQPGVGHPGFGQPGFGQPGFGQQNFAPSYGGPHQVQFGQPNFGPGHQ